MSIPFALKYRPKSMDDMVGQKHLLSPDKPLRKLVEKSALSHTFFYGPSGCGKTTLARIISKTMGYSYYELNAVSFKIDDIRKILKKYENSLEKPLIFIDEVHRLTKNQQEFLLPVMEDRRALIIGASTQNPYYSMTSAIRSRSHLFELYPIKKEDIEIFLERVLESENISIEDDAKKYLIDSSNGDLRGVLNLLESASVVSNPVTLDILKDIRPQALHLGSIESSSHYDVVSAMIKSIRGSDVDAGLYWLGLLIEGGEPPEFIARRLTILASEDIGNANPNALNLASSTLAIVEKIGYPEARIPLAQLVVYLASSPKSNSAYQAINKAQYLIKSGEIFNVPNHLKSNSNDYISPHNYGGWVKQQYLPKKIKVYKSSKIGFEKTLDEWLEKITNL